MNSKCIRRPEMVEYHPCPYNELPVTEEIQHQVPLEVRTKEDCLKNLWEAVWWPDFVHDPPISAQPSHSSSPPLARNLRFSLWRRWTKRVLNWQRWGIFSGEGITLERGRIRWNANWFLRPLLSFSYFVAKHLAAGFSPPGRRSEDSSLGSLTSSRRQATKGSQMPLHYSLQLTGSILMPKASSLLQISQSQMQKTIKATRYIRKAPNQKTETKIKSKKKRRRNEKLCKKKKT